MRAISRIWRYLRALRRARRNRTDLLGWLIRRPQLLLGTTTYETSLILANRLDPHLKELAELKAAALVECEFCLSKGQLAELAATIAWENQRARLNQALGVRPAGMAEGMTCALPETRNRLAGFADARLDGEGASVGVHLGH